MFYIFGGVFYLMFSATEMALIDTLSFKSMVQSPFTAQINIYFVGGLLAL